MKRLGAFTASAIFSVLLTGKYGKSRSIRVISIAREFKPDSCGLDPAIHVYFLPRNSATNESKGSTFATSNKIRQPCG
jgi:hypothetical protein